MAVLFFDDAMDSGLMDLALSRCTPISMWRVNEKIKAWQEEYFK